ncbi:hypothetical protein ABLT44_15165 [Acinetobacter johnsonii]|uniref:none n=1 Tax=Acinetobacter johnsonii TaxID=40214 RepID=UPI002D7F28C4|nr:none [Acinetobacter johnsonii]
MSNQKVVIDADQTELEALLNSSAPLDAGVMDDRHASALDSIDTEELSNWAARDAELDDLGSDVSTEIIYRAKLLDDAYPFKVEDGSLKIKESSINLFYIFCLVLSQSKLKAQKGEAAYNQMMARFFERSTLGIIRCSLGSLSNGHHFGFPRDNGSNIKQAINSLPKDLNISKEWKYNPLDYVENEVSNQKDLGIDQIIWIKRPDNRTFSHLFFLGQCACGGDYISKFNDIDLNKLNQYFRPFTHTHPVKMMSIPFILTDDDFQKVSHRAGWLFDRISLAGIYNKHPELDKDYSKTLIELISNSTPYGERFKKSSLYKQLASVE